MRRGWYNQSYRHSLAARGISTNTLVSRKSMAYIGGYPNVREPDMVEESREANDVTDEEIYEMEKMHEIDEIIEDAMNGKNWNIKHSKDGYKHYFWFGDDEKDKMIESDFRKYLRNLDVHTLNNIRLERSN